MTCGAIAAHGPWHYQCENNEPQDFILPTFTWVLASVKVACQFWDVHLIFPQKCAWVETWMAELLGSTRAVALSASWTGLDLQSFTHSRIILASALYVCAHKAELHCQLQGEHIQGLFCKMTEPTLLYPPRGRGCFLLLIFSAHIHDGHICFPFIFLTC